MATFRFYRKKTKKQMGIYPVSGIVHSRDIPTSPYENQNGTGRYSASVLYLVSRIRSQSTNLNFKNVSVSSELFLE